MTISANYPVIRPSLLLDFANTKQLDPRVTFSRASTGTYFDSNGVLQTAAAGVARFDHDPITGESKGLLIEEQRSNLLTYSEQFDNAAWVKSGSTVTANTATAPDGALTAEKLIETATNAVHRFEQFPTLPDNTACVSSIYVKAAERSFVYLEARTKAGTFPGAFFNLSAGSVGAISSGAEANITSVGNGWFRCSIGFNTATGGSSLYVGFQTATGSTTFGDRSYTGDGTSGIYLWGAQLEVGAFPTSYIPTVASQVTRSADTASMTGSNFSSWYRADEGTLYSEGQVETNRNYSGSFRHFFQLSPTSNVESIINIIINGFNVPQSQIKNANVNQSDLTSGSNTGTLLKFASAYKTNDFGFSTNGATVATDTSGLPAISPAIEQIRIGGVRDGNSGGQLNGTIKRLAFYPKRLSNTELQGITS